MFKKISGLPTFDFKEYYVGIYFEEETCISIIISAESQTDASNKFHEYLKEIFVIYDPNCIRVRLLVNLDKI